MTIFEQDEADVLALLWLARGREKKIKMLQMLSQVEIVRGYAMPSADAMRAELASHKKPVLCFACHDRDHKLYWHHAIWLSHGGSNAQFNVVALCYQCHHEMHPWLTPYPCEVKGWNHAVSGAAPALDTVLTGKGWDDPRCGRSFPEELKADQ